MGKLLKRAIIPALVAAVLSAAMSLSGFAAQEDDGSISTEVFLTIENQTLTPTPVIPPTTVPIRRTPQGGGAAGVTGVTGGTGETPTPEATPTDTSAPSAPPATDEMSGGMAAEGEPTPTGQETGAAPEEENSVGAGAWALVNLLCAVAAVILAAFAAIMSIRVERRRKWGIIALIPGVGAVVAFLLTERLNQPMCWTDRWTLLMALILAAELVAAFVTWRAGHQEKEDGKERSEDESDHQFTA